ncbi:MULTISPECIES: ABC transporter ATP-binding protein [unclassified Enterococcus]|uniref:ABC transporter ATP-binding protein n=1 Tax=unclassified Enterococcus TaxID=2608891 RepID=UPI0015574EE4|nr:MULTISPECIES: ABC transporter ATP-binding protein [unclassified Enterococcus]MBS7578082.1 ABC transporter ATP-binding protein [Enterococcus sp. MMGLQ5-2]MBS7585342.1 ABC transporter ATP-binding protein [Enterococcus sp. MMGLQ5-1]NPD13199.1 ABC transporter ATP-binding protein [Enterococcus sp. MMGLQ5-1]NPD37913.1 ABC transporter ATP-binding protein [Enterococcus sp. MMGLQ5-2]
MTNLIINAKGIKRQYGKGESEFFALKGVDIAIKRGESVAIIGKSGSGKSTLMHILSLMDRPTSGSLKIADQETSKFKEKELSKLRNDTFGFIFQQFFLNGSQTVLENVALPLKIAGVSKRERNEKAMEVLKLVELEDKAKNKANDLSGGQKQRVCIARALVNNPQVIFADEPTGNLDSVTSEIVENILFDLNENHGITLITVTHDDDLAEKFGRQITIKDGEVVSA